MKPFKLEDLDADHAARRWKEAGDVFGIATQLEKFVNIMLSQNHITKSKLDAFSRDKSLSGFLGFFREFRALALFRSRGIEASFGYTEKFPDISLVGGVDVEVKGRLEEETAYEAVTLERGVSADKMEKYVKRGLRKLADILDELSDKIRPDTSTPFLLYLNTWTCGLEMHFDDIRAEIQRHFNNNQSLSAVLVDDKYDLGDVKFDFVLFLNKNAKNPLPTRLVDKLTANNSRLIVINK